MDPAEGVREMVAAKSYQPCAVSGSMPGRAPGICETLPECSRYRELCKTPGVGTLRGCGRFCLGKNSRSPGKGGSSITLAGDHLRPSPDSTPPGYSSGGQLERVLRAGDFAVTAELSPPDSADPADVYQRASHFDGHVDRSTRQMVQAPTVICPVSVCVHY
ncbi:MAG: hypothetical protein Ct9H300mP16_16540 [Pseudomonadota bacterium]|nr:MAG: hypothetical protein Ct9H300mP16_16540 [Pseudomonadota bacterium]